MTDLDLVSKLKEDKKILLEFRLNSISPDDGKYGEEINPLRDYLSPRAEWLMCANIQKILL